MKKRVSAETWQEEMLCRGVKVEGAVFGAFDVSVHVGEKPEVSNQKPDGELWLGIDFGYANPFVCLWIFANEDGVFV